MTQSEHVPPTRSDLPPTDAFRGHLMVSFLTERIGELSHKYILDLGAGQGTVSIPLADTGARVFCVDIRDIALRRLRSASKKVEKGEVHPVVGAAEALPFNSESFDIVIINGVLEWVGLNSPS